MEFCPCNVVKFLVGEVESLTEMRGGCGLCVCLTEIVLDRASDGLSVDVELTASETNQGNFLHGVLHLYIVFVGKLVSQAVQPCWDWKKIEWCVVVFVAM